MPKIGNISVSLYREESDTTGKIVEALCAAQADFPVIQMDSTGFRDGESYRYASIGAIRRGVVPVLARHGIWMQHVYGESEGSAWVTTILRHKSGEYLTSTLRIPQIGDIHERKAAMTLLCRTAIEGLLSISTEEDKDARGVDAIEQPQEVDDATQEKWATNMGLAEVAIAMANDDATLEKYMAVAEKRVASGDMPPDAVSRIKRLCESRSRELKEKADAGDKSTAGDEGANAGGGGDGAPDRKRGRRPVGTGA